LTAGPGWRSWEALIDGRYCHPQKAHSALCEWMHERKRENKSLTAGELAGEIAEQFQVELSIGQINYLLRKKELTRPRGRPRRRILGTQLARPGAKHGNGIDLPQARSGQMGQRGDCGRAGLLPSPGTSAGHGRELPPLPSMRPRCVGETGGWSASA